MDHLLIILTVVLFTLILIVFLILGVRMEQAILDAQQSLADLNATIAGLVVPVPVDHTAEVVALKDGINAANQSLKDKFTPVP